MKIVPGRFATGGRVAGSVLCGLCPHGCQLMPGAWGMCRARRNASGTLVASSFGHITAEHLDPIEKKPLFHFFPGSGIYSFGSAGCSLKCIFCQNSEISQRSPEEAPGHYRSPEEACAETRARGAALIAFTYNEPLTAFEWVCDTARVSREAGLRSVLVTNGYLERQPAREIAACVDAVNLDIKALDEDFYRRLCGGKLAPVLGFADEMLGAGRHLEITNLLIPDENDSPEQVGALARWISQRSADIPLHLSRYFPAGAMHGPPTAKHCLERAAEEASRYLRFVYVGNLETGYWSQTRCPSCAEVIIERQGYRVDAVRIAGGRCARCGQPIYGEYPVP